MSLPVTLLLLAVALAAGLGCAWMGARPPNPHRGPRMAPWRFLMIVFAALGLALLTHLVNLLGVATGNG